MNIKKLLKKQLFKFAIYLSDKETVSIQSGQDVIKTTSYNFYYFKFIPQVDVWIIDEFISDCICNGDIKVIDANKNINQQTSVAMTPYGTTNIEPNNK